MKTLTVVEQIEKVSKHVPDAEVRDARDVPLMCGFRQGDLYFARVKSLTDTSPVAGRQLVQGTSRGSRHILEGDATLQEAHVGDFPTWVDRDALRSPSVRVGDGGARLTHPEHAHFLLPPNSCWVAWQQMDPRTRERVQD